MTAFEIASNLSTAATAFGRVGRTFNEYERGDRAVLGAPELASSITECIASARAVKQEFDRALYTSRGSVPDQQLDETTAMRLKHVAQDLAEAIDRLSGLLLAVEFFNLPREEWNRGRSFVGVQEALTAALAFAQRDLAQLEQRLGALLQFYSEPFESIDDQTTGSDQLLVMTLRHYDEERPGDRIHMLGADGGPRSVTPKVSTSAIRCNLVPVMFATDRPKIDGSPTLHVDYGSRLDTDTLSYGVAEVSIPRGRRHKMGRLERPSIWKFQFREDPEKHVVIITSEEKDLSAWTAIARERLTISDQKSALIFIHGFNVTFEDAIRRTAQIGWDLQFNGVITTFSWCSEGRKRSYLTDERNARLAAPRLLELLEILRKDVGVESIQVIAHSMGNLVLMEALRKLAADRHPLTLDEVIFAAPDCDAVEFRRALGEFKEKARRYTLYGSEADLALRISKDIRSDYPRAGDGGERILVVEGLETIDATAIGEDMLGLGHSYFAAKRTVLSDLFYLIQESLPAARRSGMEERQQSGVDYWLFVP